jgi:ribosomal protein S27AE
MKKFDMTTPSKLNDRHKKLADQLISLHSNKSPYPNRLPTYEYRKLKKGNVCTKCNTFMVSGGDKVLVCKKCGYVEAVESAIIRSVEELKFLFPDKKITTGLVYEWCQVIESRKMIRRILMENYTAMGKRKFCYFE